MNKNKTVLVTGASRGIGKAISEIYIKNKYNVILNCKKNINLINFEIDKFKKINNNLISIKADVSKYEECVHMFDEIKNKFNNVDILINNVGINYLGEFHLTNYKDWKKVIDTNFISALNCCHLSIPSMIKNKSGCIINISSVWGEIGSSCEALYSATKGALNSFTKSLARELGPSNINVNAVSCGVIDTDMNLWLSEEEKSLLKDNISLMRFGTVYDIANLVFYLSSNKAKYITGQIINVDGQLG